MHIGIAGPIYTGDIAHLLNGDTTKFPQGTMGAPLLATMITQLCNRGHKVTAFTLSEGLDAAEAVRVVGSRDFSIYFVPARRRAFRPFRGKPGRIVDLYAQERQMLEEAMRSVSPDVLHAHWAYEYALAAIATNLPHVITCHDSPIAVAKMYSLNRPTQSVYRWLRVLMARNALRKATCVTVVSPYMKKEIQKLARVDVDVIPNPVESLAFELGHVRNVPDVPRLAMICNGWTSLKNPAPALFAFATLRSAHPLATLDVFGFDFGRGEKGELWCKKHRVSEGISFNGVVPHHDLLRRVAKLDLLLHPSLEESFGMVIAEAMAMGLPVIGGVSSGAVPWVLGKGGLLCDVRDSTAIAKSLLAALDPKRYVQLSALGIDEVAGRFQPERVVDSFERLYSSALSRVERK